ncbi:MAG: T9SS type A sorting domain-containing protein [Chlorobiota bacterium]|jgi:hypothetical protein|nr:T9SS type A sorting domain-containing protein [Chlorobiota bacterium]QQS66123.1 MAG: T9SS type A sorting domain-containing protein [Chlorobiota bacterium]
MKYYIIIIVLIITSIKANSQNLIWEKIMKQPTISSPDYGFTFRGYNVLTDDKNNIYINGGFSPNNWQTELSILSKYNTNGNILWEFKYPFHFYPYDEFTRYALFIIGKYLFFDRNGGLNYIGCRTPSGGTLINNKLSVGPRGDDGRTSVNIHDQATGSILKEYLAFPKNYSDETLFNYGYTDVYCKVKNLRNGDIAISDQINLIITNDSGVLKHSLRIPNLGFEKSVHSIDQLSDGGILMLYTLQTKGEYNKGFNYMIKTDSTAKLLWTKVFQMEVLRSSSAAREMPNGDIAMMGYYSGKSSGKYFQKAELTMLNREGDSLWSKSYSSKNKEALSPEQMKVTKEWNLIICGAEVNFNPTGTGSNYENDWDIWLMKLDKNGNEIWQTSRKNIDSFDYANDVTIDKNGDYIVTGYINWTSMYLGKFQDSMQSSVKEIKEKESKIGIKQEQNKLKFTSENGENIGLINIEINDEIGKRIDINFINNNENKVYDISNLRTGIYFATWQEKGATKTKKIMIQR